MDRCELLIRKLVEGSVRKAVLPQKGKWAGDGQAGNSVFIPDEDEVFCYYSKEKGCLLKVKGRSLIRWLKSEYGCEGGEYRNNEPDFSPFEDILLQHVEVDQMPEQRDGTKGSYAIAEQLACRATGMSASKIREYMRRHNLTWHECGDGKTIRAIPTLINTVFKHTGGISIAKSYRAVGHVINSRYGGLRLSKGPTDIVACHGLQKALAGMKKEYRGAEAVNYGTGGKKGMIVIGSSEEARNLAENLRKATKYIIEATKEMFKNVKELRSSFHDDGFNEVEEVVNKVILETNDSLDDIAAIHRRLLEYADILDQYH